MSRFVKQYYTTSGTWQCPAGITEVLLIGCGGGGGGGGGVSGGPAGARQTGGSGGGGGALQKALYVTVVPGTIYQINIGAGGIGDSTGTNGSPGGNTTFGTLATFFGASGGGSGTAGASATTGFGGLAGYSINNNGSNIYSTISPILSVVDVGLPAMGGEGGIPLTANEAASSAGVAGQNGRINMMGSGSFTGGIGGSAPSPGTGTASGPGNSGGGGGAGPQGPGGGGGGGGGGQGTTAGGAGGLPGYGGIYLFGTTFTLSISVTINYSGNSLVSSVLSGSTIAFSLQPTKIYTVTGTTTTSHITLTSAYNGTTGSATGTLIQNSAGAGSAGTTTTGGNGGNGASAANNTGAGGGGGGSGGNGTTPGTGGIGGNGGSGYLYCINIR